MGLLDDAIREHLELKRLHGADPGQVARQEQEALGPVPRNGGSAPDPSAAQASEAVADADDHLGEPSGATPERDSAHLGEETTELDMSSVLREGSHEPEADAASMPSPVEEGGGGESLEWEMPSAASPRSSGDHEVAPASSESGAVEDPAVEDVLEATPDFLRETPEQERLWFEQRPPRDFDFDK